MIELQQLLQRCEERMSDSASEDDRCSAAERP
jgi:hypothetical protein